MPSERYMVVEVEHDKVKEVSDYGDDPVVVIVNFDLIERDGLPLARDLLRKLNSIPYADESLECLRDRVRCTIRKMEKKLRRR